MVPCNEGVDGRKNALVDTLATRQLATYFAGSADRLPTILGEMVAMDLYIYYRAATADAAAVQAAVAELQQRLRARMALAAAGSAGLAKGVAMASPLRCGLKRRPLADDAARTTWMEIYLAVPEPFPALLEAVLAESALPHLIDGNRHVEIFEEALPCA